MIPKVSVIIPIYNVEKYLSRCLESVLRQNYSDIEVICVYEPSEDDSLNIIKRFSALDKRIRVLVNDNQKGPSFSRNRGIENAAGEYIYFLDSDDWIELEAISDMVECACANSAQIVTFSSITHYASEEDELTHESYDGIYEHEYPDIMSGSEAYDLFAQNREMYCPVWHYFFRKDFLLDNQLFFCEGALHEDVLYYSNILIYANRVAVMNKCLHHYFRRKNSITDINKESAYENTMSYLRMYDSFCENQIRDKKLETNAQNILIGTRNTLADAIWNYCNAIGSIDKLRMLKENAERSGLAIWFEEILARHDKIILTREGLDRIKSYKRIYIYGAGKISKKIIYRLVENGIRIDGILVTNISENKELWLDSLIDIKDFKYDDSGNLIIVGVGKELSKNVLSTVNKYVTQCKVMTPCYDQILWNTIFL